MTEVLLKVLRALTLISGFSLGILSASVLADANQGELAGYRLGAKFSGTGESQAKPQADASIRFTAAAIDLTDGFEQVHVYITPSSRIIGKIIVSRRCDDLPAAEELAAMQKRRIEEQYADWEALKSPIPFGKNGGAMVSRLQRQPYALIVFYRSEDGQVSVSMELEFAGASPERKAWRAKLAEENDAAGATP